VFVTGLLGGGDGGGIWGWHEKGVVVVVTRPVLGGGGVFEAVSRRWWVHAHLTHIPIHVPCSHHLPALALPHWLLFSFTR
jgi:hypothetical protein